MGLIDSPLPHSSIVAGLRGLGYHDSLLVENYAFSDWFSHGLPERRAAVAAFGQSPISYDSALIGVACAGSLRGPDLIDAYRSLGAPLAIEIDRTEVREWAVSRLVGGHRLLGSYPTNRIDDLFRTRGSAWQRETLLRDKNIGSFHWAPELTLFAGLIPELEDHIQENLEPMLRSALSAAKSEYIDTKGKDPDPSQLFSLVFWLLMAKVFHDRGVAGFSQFSSPDPDDLLAAVAQQYRQDVPPLLNRSAREAAASAIWQNLDFRNLSVEVLSQIWPTTLIDAETKKKLGIHRTPRTVVRYIIENLPFSHSDEKRIVLEPCSGSGVFLIGAMNHLRHQLFGMSAAERHTYFSKHLAAIEKDPFGVEISRLALTLADFPNPGGWVIKQADVFDPNVLKPLASRAGVVLCNPPFETFDDDERQDYEWRSLHKPAEILHRILDDLHPSGVLGFVLPRRFMTSLGYADVRKRLAERFASIELTVLPDRVFEADAEVVLMIATKPIPHSTCRVTNRRVRDDAESWQRFESNHAVSSEATAEMTVEDSAKGMHLPELPNVWRHLIDFPTLGEVAELHRGIEWNKALTKKGNGETGHRETLVRWTPAEGYRRGVAPRTKFNVFEQPAMPYLSMRKEDRRTDAYLWAWDRPKAILNKSTRSRGHWRMAAFADSEGVVCYQTYIGVWPKSENIDEWIIAAVLNSPLANAFVTTREGKVDITVRTLRKMPFPIFTAAQTERLRELIRSYRRLTAAESCMDDSHLISAEAEQTLKMIDATVLDGYHLPARVEHELLEFFRYDDRPTPFTFSPYLPHGEDVYFSLSERLSPQFRESTAGAYLKRMAAS